MSFLVKKSNPNPKPIIDNAIQEARNLYKTGDVEIIVRPYKDKRSGEQNRYFWALAKLLGDYIGHDKEDIKDFLMDELGYYTEHQKGLKTVIKMRSTTTLKIDEFSVLISLCQDYLNQNGVNFPQPEYYGYSL